MGKGRVKKWGSMVGEKSSRGGDRGGGEEVGRESF